MNIHAVTEQCGRATAKLNQYIRALEKLLVLPNHLHGCLVEKHEVAQIIRKVPQWLVQRHRAAQLQSPKIFQLIVKLIKRSPNTAQQLQTEKLTTHTDTISDMTGEPATNYKFEAVQLARTTCPQYCSSTAKGKNRPHTHTRNIRHDGRTRKKYKFEPVQLACRHFL